MTFEQFWQYIPEINAFTTEAGPGPVTWIAAGEAWVAMAMESFALVSASAANDAGVIANSMGLAAFAMAANSPPFFAWLGMALSNALLHAAACNAVAMEYMALRGGIIPLALVTQNRISEMVAEATNIFGVNTGLIIELNREYAQFWGQNAGSKTSYATAIAAATIPRPLPIPPPIASVAGAGGSVARAATSVATAAPDAVLNSSMQAISTQTLTQGNTAGQTPADMMGSMTGMMSSFMSLPSTLMGTVTSLPQTLMSPVQSAVSPLMSAATNAFKPNVSGLDRLTGYSPVSNAFTSAGSHSNGGLPLGQYSGSGVGSGYEAKQTSYSHGIASSAPLTGIANLLGPSAMKTGMPAAPPVGGGGPVGGMPMGGHGAHGQGLGNISKKDRPTITPAPPVKPKVDHKTMKEIRTMFA